MSSSNVVTHTGLSTGAIVGIVVGSVAALFLLILVIWMARKRAAAASAAVTPATYSNMSGNNGAVPGNPNGRNYR